MLNFWWKKKANYRIRDGARGARGRGPWVTVFLWIFGVALVLWFVYPRALSWVLVQVTTPLSGLGAWYETSTHAVPAYFRGVDAVRAERDALQALVDTTEDERTQYYALQQENALLRKLQDSDAQQNSVLAGVLAAPPYIPYDLMVIDRGTGDGLSDGMYAFDEESRALGMVRTVYSDRAIVQLFSSPGAHTTVFVPSVRLFASAEGMGGGVIRVRIPQDISIEVGTLVVLPGIASARIGKVTHLEAEPTSPEQSAYITTHAPHVHQFVRIDTRPRVVPTFEELRAILRDYNPELGDITLPAAYIKESHVSSTTLTTGTTSASGAAE
ncbi:hypothetical protein A3C87_02495 [Candidatus Kaiserbacteria bacterium RIFCSPHIGHO2_02_FULL_49_34]|uniref:Cell shape-determining protein MreC n=1 Tax=Candidatus Kaiserbacteria bacterium RIFCSPHIGHO2_02_FULL_49_34 TaxID=1798491 RepID=A0A1F6DIN8_9BACT|nr:MAG: hypothetical protein A3C87_02495 [Candidatus Kaiserbacteria bacterium RIFCSPHIGHO2_02_FULL_49_34]